MSASHVMASALSALSGRNGDDSSTTHAAVSGQRVSLVAYDTLTNRGLIDGDTEW